MLAEMRLWRREAASALDRGSARGLWLCAAGGLALALICKELRWLPLGVDGAARLVLALPLFVGGLALRGWAVRELGRHFSAQVQVQPDHALVRSGPYRWLRHPSYTGLLLAFAGAGLAMGDALALLALLLPTVLAVRYRIRIEEQTLMTHFQHEYAAYCADTKRLLPWVW